ncbi:alpha/beta hydrolase [Pseudonocardia ailaonensis]|uniref:Alpha/beta hydrolase n=1 Tax=Pseudonocardia ailaonensis TaxID=367279 RepID=A0ABN2N4F9_9PSEU
MTVAGTVPVASSWSEPEGIAPRGTLIVVPGRGEHAGVYQRFGTRIAADGYRVRAVSDPTVDTARALAELREVLDEEPSGQAGTAGPAPRVLVGSDTGALFAAGLVASGELGDRVDGLVLAGLTLGSGSVPADWESELTARTGCPTHQGRLAADAAVRRGALADPVDPAWVARAQGLIPVPVLGLHGDDDEISPLADVRIWFGTLPRVELHSIIGGRHDALNDQTHRTAAALTVLFLERLRLGVPAIAQLVATR